MNNNLLMIVRVADARDRVCRWLTACDDVHTFCLDAVAANLHDAEEELSSVYGSAR